MIALAGALIAGAVLRHVRSSGRASAKPSVRQIVDSSQRLAVLPRPPAVAPAAFDIGYDQVLRCDEGGLRIKTRELTLSRRGQARKLFGETVFIAWDRLERIDVKPHRWGTDTIDSAEYLFHLKDGEQRAPDIKSFDQLRARSSDGPVNRWLIDKLEGLVREEELSSLTRIPFSIERNEDTPGQEAFVDYCRAVGQTPVTVYGRLTA